jgi:hypothetical protein
MCCQFADRQHIEIWHDFSGPRRSPSGSCEPLERHRRGPCDIEPTAKIPSNAPLYNAYTIMSRVKVCLNDGRAFTALFKFLT